MLSVGFVGLLAVFGVCSASQPQKNLVTSVIIADSFAPHTPKTAVRYTQRKSKKMAISSKKRKKPRKIAVFLLKTICSGVFF